MAVKRIFILGAVVAGACASPPAALPSEAPGKLPDVPAFFHPLTWGAQRADIEKSLPNASVASSAVTIDERRVARSNMIVHDVTWPVLGPSFVELVYVGPNVRGSGPASMIRVGIDDPACQ